MPIPLWSESFDHFGTTIALLSDGLWAAIDSGWELSTTQARTGTHSIRHTGGLYNNRRRIRRTFGGERNQVGVAFGLYLPSLPTAADTHFSFSSITDTPIITGVYQTDGSIRFYSGGNSGTFSTGDATLLGTADAVLQAGTWNHVEIIITRSETVGSVECRINALTKFEATDLNLGTAGAASIRWGGNGTGNSIRSQEHYLDDIFSHDGSEFAGQARVRTEYVPMDLSPFDWVINGSSSGAGAIDESPPDDDSSYITALNPGDVASFSMPELPADVEEIIGVYIPARMRQDDAGATTVEMEMVSGAATENGGSNPLTTGWQFLPYIFTTDPALSPAGPWTKTSFEAAELRVVRTE